MTDIKTILDYCNLKGVEESQADEWRWRMETIFDTPPDPKKSLCVNTGGAFKCHRSGKSGHVVELYAESIGKPISIARANLKKLGLIPREFYITKPNLDYEKKETEDLVRETFKNVKTSGVDWSGVGKWRGLPKEKFEKASMFGAFGYLDAYPGVGSAYVFVSNTPAMEGSIPEMKSVMVRSTIPETKGWKSVGAYPIWVSEWKKDAKEVWLVEGQWDALALECALEKFSVSKKIQVMALVGGKDISKYPEILHYFSDKKVIQIPDNDPVNTKGVSPGESILVKTAQALEQTTATHKLLRLPNGKGKDFNEWWKSGISGEQFEMWMDSIDEFRVSNGVVIDSHYREKHKLGLNAMVEVGPDGEPVEIYFRNAKGVEAANSKSLFELIRPFDLLSRYTQEASKVTEAPIIFHVLSFMTIFSAMIGRRLKFESGSAGALYPDLYTLLAGPSGRGKSEAMNMLKGVVARVNPKLLIGDGFSAEAMFDELQEFPTRLLLSNEFSEWMNCGDTHYRNIALKQFIKLYDAHHYSEENPYTFKFRKAQSVSIAEPYFCVLAACTEEQLMMKSDHLRGGMVGRFIYGIGRERHRTVSIPGRIPLEMSREIEAFFKSVLMTPNRINSAMRLSKKAWDLYEIALKKQTKFEESMDMASEMQTYTSRWRVQVFKFAMLFELLRRIHEWPLKDSDVVISEEAMIAAIRMVCILQKSFYEAFEEQFKSEGESREAKIQARIIRFLMENSENGDGVKRTDVLKRIQGRMSLTDDVLNTLKESGQILEKHVKSKGPGRPKIVYLLAKPKDYYENEIDIHLGSDPDDGRNEPGSNDSEHKPKPVLGGMEGGIDKSQLCTPVGGPGAGSSGGDTGENRPMDPGEP